MRAGRLVTMLLILQRRGRVTAGALSEELGVAERTVLRDVQALHEAGVPIYTSQGAGGGIELVDGYRTVLTGLTSDEAAVILLIGQPRMAEQLGLLPVVTTARLKVLAALAPPARLSATLLDGWLLVDPDGWEGSPPGALPQLGSAIRRQRVVELIRGDNVVEVRPLGLVNKAGGWHLVHLGSVGPSAIDLMGLTGVVTSRVTFTAPAGFDLAQTWSALTSSYRPDRTVSPAL
jgi:predicted DNA-binding transcriptional regulator YafY